MNKRLLIFIIRWLFSSVGIWAAVRFLGKGYDTFPVGVVISGYLFAGLIFSIVNSVIKPIMIVLALPAIAITLGFFMLIINGFMVYISLKLTPDIKMDFMDSIITGLLLSLINYILDTIIMARSKVAERKNK